AAGRPNVHCMGYVEKARAIPLIRGSDVLVQPSFFDEVSSSILEAMSCGTAVVASDLVGTAEMVRDGESGVLVDPKDPDRFAKEIVGLLDDPGRRGRLEEAAAEAAKGYGWDVIVEKYLKLYRSLS
ncbi:MAG: glycosyltransferase family 4 protein, partial [Nitrosopumilus sp.]|nr:glycosyltransferase family 4 protein [Nitrosopumilus sp.]